MRLTRKTDTATKAEKSGLGLNRRQFLKSASLATGGIAAASMLGAGMMRKAEAKDVPHNRDKTDNLFSLFSRLWCVC